MLAAAIALWECNWALPDRITGPAARHFMAENEWIRAGFIRQAQRVIDAIDRIGADR